MYNKIYMTVGCKDSSWWQAPYEWTVVEQFEKKEALKQE